eukprot:TRINITY_DN17399_c0_g1_i2.p1 TRINITY_DN17399_c0_g1~~TRINITY_DN17399_c0_g1_i2.p1  ORF type:complete len:694 (+),score=198.03 TRINITY_DN17399_c0_g1_i2:111-2192(+)
MASDDEGDFRRRDKFHAERHGSHSRYRDNENTRYPQDSQPFWKFQRAGPAQGNSSHHRGPPRGYEYPPDSEWGDMSPPGQHRHGMPPPAKRSRESLEGDEQEGFRSPPQQQSTSSERKSDKNASSRSAFNDGFQPLKMTFKAFLSTQDDSITDEEAAQKYGEYKMEFRRQQLNEFFSCHKESEWFRVKYHPEESKKRKEVISSGVNKRMATFQDLVKAGFVKDVSVNIDAEFDLVKLFDRAVIILEGGTEKDLQILDHNTSQPEDSKDEKDKENVDETTNSKALHKTTSIFLKSLPANITSSELVTVCKRYPGFLRVCISDPDQAKKWARRAWVTFERETKIKEICFNLNNVRIRGSELGPVVNKDLSKRIRTVAAIYNHSKVARNDIKLAAKIINNLDMKAGLYMTTSNPLLANVQDYLIEEVSAEEDELLGLHGTGEQGTGTEEKKEAIKENPKLLKVLDELILYLRIVHSVDFYNCLQYPYEDEMPNRCGIFHVRSNITEEMVTDTEIEDHNKNMEKKLKALLDVKSGLSDEEANKLGLKTEEDEVEKFISSNSQEVAKDKWLCPLSGKKFKGPDFIRKHIFNKYAENVDVVKQETMFFNNYLKDPVRPELPENPNKKVAAASPKPMPPPRRYPEHEFGQEEHGFPHPPRGRKRSIHERLGRSGIRATHLGTDPREMVDYSDIDLGSDFF